jgi:hypothetical protein
MVGSDAAVGKPTKPLRQKAAAIEWRDRDRADAG